jgi:DNA-binding helix-hairpin-helix protein with protein kinase domain
MLDFYQADGSAIRLGSRIGGGGEGDVYAIDGSNDRAIKYYTDKKAHEREGKVRRMVSEGLSGKFPLVAFPISMAFDRAKRFAGFVMARVTGHQPLFELYAPGARKAAFPQANYRFLVICAGNIARAVGAAHAAGCVVGDINHSGFLISPEAKVRLIDADSFQVSEGTKHYFCKVGVPEYTPPELQNQALGGVLRTANHDAFGLAVVIFQLLLMGRHPFSGSFARGEMPTEKAIGEHRFAYSRTRSVGMVPPPGVPTLDDFPPKVGAAFEAAFSPNGPQRRPTAKDWIGILDELKDSLKVCAKSPLHHYPNGTRDCPWCRLENRYGVPLFLPPIQVFNPNATFAPTAGDVLSIWRAIEAVRPPSPRPFPQFTGTTSPSAAVTEVSQTQAIKRWWGWGLIAAAIIGAVAAPNAILLAFVAAGVGWWLAVAKSTGDLEALQQYRTVQTRIFLAEAEWEKHNSGVEFLDLRQSLKSTKETYEGLPREQARRLEEYTKNRRAVQLQMHLSTCLIRRFDISKIGTGRKTILLSYGIETAADISEAAVLRVPGFGPGLTEALLSWRRSMEGRFVYVPGSTPADTAAMNAIKADVAQKAVRLKDELSTGPAKLTRLSASITARQEASVLFNVGLLAQRAQCVADLQELRRALPDVPRPQPMQRTAPAPGVASVTVHQSSSPNHSPCPSCGGAMVIRTARHGSNAGNRFWGCAKYPRCTGTRSIP